MPGYVGFQIALELTNLVPREVVTTGFTQLLDFARDLRKSGSNIVVEEDLAEIFGRGRISGDLETKFKSQVRIQKFTPLSHGSEVGLAEGPGPTMLRALHESKYFATVVTLSMLGYFHNRDSLAQMISRSITQRLEANVSGPTGDPGYSGIADTLTACSTQSAAFRWSTYRQLVEEKLRLSIPDYRYLSGYTSLTPATLLGAMDFLYIVQKLPDDRKISVSCETGCIALVIWAHYILELNVLIRREACAQVVFGNPEEAHVYIEWLGESSLAPLSESDRTSKKMYDPVIRLHEKNMSVILSCENSLIDRFITRTEERLPLGGYGTTYLRRFLNYNAITPDHDPIYREILSFATGLAIYTSKNLDRRLLQKDSSTNGDEEPGQAIHLEVWRVIRSAELLFTGIELDIAGVESYKEFLARTHLTESSLPTQFTMFLDKSRLDPVAMAREFLKEVKVLTSLILIFAHVIELDKCCDMPLRVRLGLSDLPFLFEEKTGEYSCRFQMESAVIFHTISGLLSSCRPQDYSALESEGRILNSDFGWSVFLDTFGNKDPGQSRPGLIHIQKGTPTNKRTGERKLHISDGQDFATYLHNGAPSLTRSEYVPRAVARVRERTEYWTTQEDEFELTLYWLIEPSPELGKAAKRGPNEESIHYGKMHESLWETFSTPDCTHPQSQRSLYNRSTRKPAVKLPEDAVAVVGWTEPTFRPEKVLVLLTLGEPELRWLAIMKRTDRKTMLRTEGCCEECAVEHACSFPGNWALVL